MPTSPFTLGVILVCYLQGCVAFAPIKFTTRSAKNKNCVASTGIFKSNASGFDCDVGGKNNVGGGSDSNGSIAMMLSFSVISACRRLSFLVLSIAFVDTFRTSVLKIPKTNKNMCDECPWPFTLFHDPKKFAKDGLTWTVFLWAGLCQLYSLIMKARAAGSLPSKIFV
ncbi:hypothetical protein ACHAXN_009422 [Cyclotella atomus]